MRIFAATMLLLVASVTFAEEPVPFPAPIISVDAMRFKPPLNGILDVATRSGLRSVSTSVTVVYDQSGSVVAVKLEKPTGVKSLDRAIRAWAAKIKIKANEPGAASIPITMSMSG